MAPKTLDGTHPDRYKWIALTNTTLGIFMATINSSIILISLPAIFRGIGIDPLSAGNVGYLLWLLQGYLLVTAVLVISLGRLGDIMGRVRIFNLGFAVFSFASVLLALAPSRGSTGALGRHLGRCVPVGPARHGPGYQSGRGHRGLLHRSDRRGTALRRRLAPGL